MAKVFLACSGVSGARKVTGASQRKIVMLAVPIDDYQATTLLEMGERRARQHLNNSGEFRFIALLCGDKQKYPIPPINMRGHKTDALRLPRHSFGHSVKGPAQLGALAQPQVRQYLLKHNIVLPFLIWVE